jgi:hypothetical protein
MYLFFNIMGSVPRTVLTLINVLKLIFVDLVVNTAARSSTARNGRFNTKGGLSTKF